MDDSGRALQAPTYMKGARQAPREPDLRLVNDLSPATPPDREMVLSEVFKYAKLGALRILDNEPDAEDIAQDIVLDVMKKLQADPWYLGDPKERKRISRKAGQNKGINWLEAMRTREGLEPADVAELEAAEYGWANPDTTLEELEFRSAAEHALEQFSDDEQSVWKAVHDLGLKPKEIDPEHARSLSVKNSRTKKKLQNMLRRFQPGREA